jgi:hypothetical protein
MNIRLLLPAKVQRGQLLWVDPVKTSKIMSKYEGKDVLVDVSEPKRKASDKQRAYYWAVIIPILSEYTGYEGKDMHEINKKMFLKREKMIGETLIEYGGSTEELSTTEKEEFHSKIREFWSVHFNVWIPLPNEVSYTY